MASSRKQDLPVDSSWRMVEGGENDSFDTSMVRDDYDDIILSSDPSQLSSGSQGQFSLGGSQDDSLQRFVQKAERGDQVLLSSPFRPSLPASVRQDSSETAANRSPEPQFYMPRVEVDSPRKGSGASSRTVRPADAFPRRRNVANRNGSPQKPTRTRSGRMIYSDNGDDSSPPPKLVDRFLESLPSAIFDTLAWVLAVFTMALRYAQRPLAILLAIYFTFGALIMAQNMATRSIYTSLSPICRIPGVSWLDLPFCPSLVPKESADGKSKPVEFDGLMHVQERFEEVLEQSANGVSLPMEMKRSEASVRDLRTMVRYSGLQSKEELVLEFDGYIESARTASNDLQKFNTHVGSAVDSVISINRWTSRYLDSLAAERESQSWLSDWASWAFAPFQPATTFSERNLLDKYVEHTGLVSDRIGDLIVEAQAVLRTLSKAEDHLGIIYDFVTRTQRSVRSRRDEILWTLWTLVGANARSLHNLNAQLGLLRRVDAQRGDAVRQVSELIVELEKIQAGLGDLRDRVAEPELVRATGRHEAVLPLSVHIETINKGVERLEEARSRIRAIENARIREVLARGGAPDEKLIESS